MTHQRIPSVITKDFLKDKLECDLLLSYMIDNSEGSEELLIFKNIVVDTFNRKNKVGLKLLRNDLHQWVKAFPRNEVESLKSHVSEVVKSYDDEIINNIRRVISRGYIENSEEYFLVGYFGTIEST